MYGWFLPSKFNAAYGTLYELVSPLYETSTDLIRWLPDDLARKHGYEMFCTKDIKYDYVECLYRLKTPAVSIIDIKKRTDG